MMSEWKGIENMRLSTFLQIIEEMEKREEKYELVVSNQKIYVCK